MEKTVFMIMPFNSTQASSAYDRCIKPLCDELGLSIRRADDYRRTGPVYDDIMTGIRDASIVIADITGSNPNVLYELGIAHTLKQTRTIIVNSDDFEKVPFDVRHFRIVKYVDSMGGADELKETLGATISGLLLDLRATHEREFEVATGVLGGTNQYGFLYSLIGLSQYSEMLRRQESVSVEGHLEDQSHFSGSVSAEHQFSAAIDLGYAQTVGEQVMLTELGRAFVGYLSDQGYVCDRFNDQIFTDGFVPMLDRASKSSQGE